MNKANVLEEKWIYWSLPIILFVFLVVMLPLKNGIILYCYYRENPNHISILPGKPTKFSDGNLVPTFPDAITGFGAFALSCILGVSVTF